jgi:hypothetical protein
VLRGLGTDSLVLTNGLSVPLGEARLLPEGRQFPPAETSDQSGSTTA